MNNFLGIAFGSLKLLFSLCLSLWLTSNLRFEKAGKKLGGAFCTGVGG